MQYVHPRDPFDRLVSSPVWDAAAYHQVATLQHKWGRALLSRHDWRGDERVLDVGCGTGMLAGELLEAHPGAHVVAVDTDPGMVKQAQETLQPYERAQVLQADVMRLPRLGPFDLVISNAVLHWVHDHDAAFQNIHRELVPGGRLLAQCGGKGNLAGVHAIATAIMDRPPFAEAKTPVHKAWNYQDDVSTRERLVRAGFRPATARLEDYPARFATDEEWERFLRVVTLRVYLHALPEPLHGPYLAAYREQARTSGLERRLDFIRLSMDARRS